MSQPYKYSLSIVIPKDLVEIKKIRRGDKIVFKLTPNGTIVIEKIEGVKKI